MTRTRLLILTTLLLGCSGDTTTLEVGCHTGDEVPKALRKEVEEAARQFYDRVRAQDWQGIYDNTASAVRGKRSGPELVEPIARAVASVGLPTELETQEVSVVKFGAGFPPTPRVPCEVEGKEHPMVLLLNDHPEQASLVQRGAAADETFYYSTLWIREEGTWRLGAFFVKPATLFGKSADEYAKQAASENTKEHARNAALLYNLALDLAVPAAWIKPPEIEDLRQEQSRLQVENLPAGASLMATWGTAPDSFVVADVNYARQGDMLGLLVRYVSQGAIEDSTFQDGRARELVEVIRAELPEFLEVFDAAAIQAYDPEDPKRTWTHVYPFRSRQ